MLANCNLEELAEILTGQLTVSEGGSESKAAPATVVLRCLGDTGRIAGFENLIARLRALGCNILALSGTGEPMPELAAASTVSPSLVQDAMAYFQAGGPANIASFFGTERPTLPHFV